jgi:hypothetical protein
MQTAVLSRWCASARRVSIVARPWSSERALAATRHRDKTAGSTAVGEKRLGAMLGGMLGGLLDGSTLTSALPRAAAAASAAAVLPARDLAAASRSHPWLFSASLHSFRLRPVNT